MAQGEITPPHPRRKFGPAAPWFDKLTMRTLASSRARRRIRTKRAGALSGIAIPVDATMPDSLARNRPPPGRQALVAVDRAIAELRRGAPVILGDGAAATVVLAAETAEHDGLGRLFALCGGTVSLALTARRASALGLIGQAGSIPSGSVAILAVGAAAEANELRRLADPAVDLAGVPAAYRFRLSAGGEIAAYAPAAIDL